MRIVGQAAQRGGLKAAAGHGPAPQRYASVNAATPGSSMPARNSREAPPPVEMWEIWPATPADLMAFSESPPPTTEVAPETATALASATVPWSKGGFSKIPMGPFQITVLAPAITAA